MLSTGYRTESGLPIRKVLASGIVGAIVTLIISIAEGQGYKISPEVAASLVTVLTFLAGYLTPPSGDDRTVKT
jgi:hypothetical protein